MSLLKQKINQYVIVERIGSSMSVFIGYDETTKKKVVIKATPSGDALFKKAMEAEIKIGINLSRKCSYLVRYEEITLKENQFFIIMEYCSEGCLADLLSHRIELKSPFTDEEIFRFAAHVGKGIQTLHNESIVHRDLKPPNIFLTKNGVFKVGDFGISRVIDPSKSKTTVVMASIGYASPEVLDGEENLAKSMDIYSLGCMILEMIDLHHPFANDKGVIQQTKVLMGRINGPKHTLSVAVKALRDHACAMVSVDPAGRPPIEALLSIPSVLAVGDALPFDVGQNKVVLAQAGTAHGKDAGRATHALITLFNLQKPESPCVELLLAKESVSLSKIRTEVATVFEVVPAHAQNIQIYPKKECTSSPITTENDQVFSQPEVALLFSYDGSVTVGSEGSGCGSWGGGGGGGEGTATVVSFAETDPAWYRTRIDLQNRKKAAAVLVQAVLWYKGCVAEYSRKSISEGKVVVMLWNYHRPNNPPVEMLVPHTHANLRKIRSEVGKTFDLPIFQFQNIRIFSLGKETPNLVTEDDEVFMHMEIRLQFRYDGVIAGDDNKTMVPFSQMNPTTYERCVNQRNEKTSVERRKITMIKIFHGLDDPAVEMQVQRGCISLGRIRVELAKIFNLLPSPSSSSSSSSSSSTSSSSPSHTQVSQVLQSIHLFVVQRGTLLEITQENDPVFSQLELVLQFRYLSEDEGKGEDSEGGKG